MIADYVVEKERDFSSESYERMIDLFQRSTSYETHVSLSRLPFIRQVDFHRRKKPSAVLENQECGYELEQQGERDPPRPLITRLI